MSTNNYKTDEGKAPVVTAIFVPFRRTLLAIAEMMERQKTRHKLQGARDPFQEWRQLPNGKDRLVNAGGRHAMEPWEPNTKDRVGDHPGDLHILHAIWGLMAAYEKHVEDMAVPADPCCGAPDARPLHHPAGADWRGPPTENTRRLDHLKECQCPFCVQDGSW